MLRAKKILTTIITMAMAMVACTEPKAPMPQTQKFSSAQAEENGATSPTTQIHSKCLDLNGQDTKKSPCILEIYADDSPECTLTATEAVAYKDLEGQVSTEAMRQANMLESMTFEQCYENWKANQEKDWWGGYNCTGSTRIGELVQERDKLLGGKSSCFQWRLEGPHFDAERVKTPIPESLPKPTRIIIESYAKRFHLECFRQQFEDQWGEELQDSPSTELAQILYEMNAEIFERLGHKKKQAIFDRWKKGFCYDPKEDAGVRKIRFLLSTMDPSEGKDALTGRDMWICPIFDSVRWGEGGCGQGHIADTGQILDLAKIIQEETKIK